MVTRVLLLARVQFTHGVFLREKRSKAELWASVGPRLKTDVLSRATQAGKHNPYLYYPPRLLPILGYSDKINK